MKLEDFLGVVKEGLGLDNLREADRVVRVVVGALKSTLPEEKARAIAEALPEELSTGWESVLPLPEEFLERAEMFLEEGERPEEKPQYPTITDG
jgi:uncharacterized protein (DUF2267 family)